MDNPAPLTCGLCHRTIPSGEGLARIVFLFGQAQEVQLKGPERGMALHLYNTEDDLKGVVCRQCRERIFDVMEELRALPGRPLGLG